MSKILFDALKSLRELHRDNPGTVQIIEDAIRENRDDPESTTNVRKVCKTCGSERLTFEAALVWDDEMQNYEIANVYDDVFCLDCNNIMGREETEIEN